MNALVYVDIDSETQKDLEIWDNWTSTRSLMMYKNHFFQFRFSYNEKSDPKFLQLRL